MACKKSERGSVFRKIASSVLWILGCLLGLLCGEAMVIGGAAFVYKSGEGWVEKIVVFLTQRFDYPAWADWQIHAALGLLALGLAVLFVLLARGGAKALGRLFKEQTCNKYVKKYGDAWSFHERAIYYYKQKNYDRALADLDKAIVLSGEETICWYFTNRAECLQKLERGEEAAEDYRQAAACLLVDAARLEEHEKEEKKKEEGQPTKSKRLPEWFGWVAAAVAAAIAGLAIFACPLLGQASAERAEAYMLYGNQYESDWAYKRSLRANSVALLFLPKAESPAQYNQRGVTYGYFGEHEKAIKDYSRAINAAKGYYSWREGEYPLHAYYFNRANEYYITHEYAKAIDDQLKGMDGRRYNSYEDWENNTLAEYYDAAGNKTKADEARAEAEKYASP